MVSRLINDHRGAPVFMTDRDARVVWTAVSQDVVHWVLMDAKFYDLGEAGAWQW